MPSSSSPALLSLLALACGCSPGADFSSHRGRVIHGVADLNPAHAGVVAVTTRSTLCSGTLIAPRVVLTAAHCAEDAVAEDFEVHFGDNLRTATSLAVELVLVHPDYVPLTGQEPAVYDLALLRLAAPPPGGVVPIAPLPAHMGLSDADIGETLEFVGFGEDEWGVTGLKLSGKNELSWVCVEPRGCAIVLGAEAGYNTICYDERPAGPCSGDSGGPALVMRGNLEFVAGATSYGDSECRYYGCSTKVDAYQEWLEAFTAGTLGTACAADADCQSGTCERGVCCAEPCPGLCASCAVPGYAGSCQPLPDGASCGDGDPCTGEESCQAGACVATPALDCDDGEACTTDTCRPMFGCEHAPAPDGEPCGDEDVCDGEERCVNGRCAEGEPLVCRDGDGCTRDLCDPLLGCQHPPAADGTACEAEPCGEGACRAGACEATDPPACAEGGPCTTGRCVPGEGCVYTAVAEGTPCGPCMVCEGSLCVALEGGCPEESGCGCGASPRGGASSGLALLAFGLSRLRRRRR